MGRRIVAAVVCLLASCSSPGMAEDFTWSIDCPKSVDKGAEFTFVVKATKGSGATVDGVRYRYAILWPQGSTNPLRHKGLTGDQEKVHAHLATGPATIVVTCENRSGLETKVLETTFEVK